MSAPLNHRIVAIGSPHGDDQAAFRLVERLSSRPGLKGIAVGDPSRLLDLVDGCERLVIVDACLGSGPPGTVTRLEWPDARIDSRRSGSGHGIGVADVLRLAEQLDRLPAKVVLFGIELSHCLPGQRPSGVVEGALPDLEQAILREIESAPCTNGHLSEL